jgi:hypothetical protein
MTPGKDDSVDTVAAALAAAIRQERSALSVGPVITVPDARSILARVVMSGTMHSEIRRQERDIRVIFWCPNPTLRDLVSREVDLGLAQHPFLELPDGSSARITYKGTVVFDQAQNAQLYRRDLIMTADYPTVLVETQPPMLFGALELNAMDVIA